MDLCHLSYLFLCSLWLSVYVVPAGALPPSFTGAHLCHHYMVSHHVPCLDSWPGPRRLALHGVSSDPRQLAYTATALAGERRFSDITGACPWPRGMTSRPAGLTFSLRGHIKGWYTLCSSCSTQKRLYEGRSPFSLPWSPANWTVRQYLVAGSVWQCCGLPIPFWFIC